VNRKLAALVIGIGVLSLSACATIREIRDMDREPTDAEKAAKRAEHAQREAVEVAALVKRLNEIPTGWNWAWRGGELVYGAVAEDDRVAAAYALGHQYKAYSAIPDLAVALKDKDDRVRINAASSLLEMADHASAVQAALKEALNDPYYQIRLDAVRTLVQLGVPTAELMPTLDGVAAGTSPSDAVEAADLLISMGRDPSGLVPVLMNAMADPELSETVIDDLSDQYENPAYLPILLMGLNSADTKVRAGCISLLGGPTYASPEVTAALRKASTSWIPDVRKSAAAALVVGGDSEGEPGKVAGPGTGAANESIAKLLKLLGDRDESVRRTAVESLGRLKDSSPEVIAALRTSLKDHDEDVREATADALGAIGKPAQAAVPDLWAIWNDSRKPKAGKFDWIVADAAARALYWGMGEDVENGVTGWYGAQWGMNPSQVRAAFEKDGVSITEEGGPPPVLGIDRVSCGCGQAARCKWVCSDSPTVEASGPTIPVSVSFVFDAAGLLSKVQLQSHVGDLSRCQEIGTILAGLEWTYSTSHTKTPVSSPAAPAATTWSYDWSLATSRLTYRTETTPAACEIELAYAKDDTSHPGPR